MGILSRLEAFLERLFEAPAGRLGAKLQPVLLTKRIERAMDSSKSFGAAGIIVPNRYDMHLHPSDFAAFEPYRASLEDDLAHGAMARARREHYHLVARPTVHLIADVRVPRGDVQVAAAVVDDAGDRVPEVRAISPSAQTMVLARPGHEVAPPDSATRAYLLVRTQGAPLVRFDLGSALISVGRASDNDVIVDDPEVSRHHCQLKLQHGAYSFADLGSRNGSWVNGQPVSEVALGPGDSIMIGSTEIEFQVGG
jgi:FhaA, N-terminal domain/FHA domain